MTLYTYICLVTDLLETLVTFPVTSGNVERQGAEASREAMTIAQENGENDSDDEFMLADLAGNGKEIDPDAAFNAL